MKKLGEALQVIFFLVAVGCVFYVAWFLTSG